MISVLFHKCLNSKFFGAESVVVKPCSTSASQSSSRSVYWSECRGVKDGESNLNEFLFETFGRASEEELLLILFGDEERFKEVELSLLDILRCEKVVPIVLMSSLATTDFFTLSFSLNACDRVFRREGALASWVLLVPLPPPSPNTNSFWSVVDHC
ncbi:hypothetical protein WICPIJ_008581 [Wickerhamomyces pijperi]|uniref:Uncharacterized protein n=1 Tax=Wickerhamomyces pijperi TaxID=599730 RepID=A0A9P8PW37_WICPI|nr:hypothetical protein WICPIJ_008581 [Wickerhamomyces pijperi]